MPHEPFWLCHWLDVVFLHLEVDAAALQPAVPFTLDLFEGRAYVSLVAFTLADFHPRCLGSLGRWIFRPFGAHRFLNLRAYVRQGAEAGIHFLAEWLDAPRLNRLLGPWLYGLPFHLGRLDYRHSWQCGAGVEPKATSTEVQQIYGAVHTAEGSLAYHASPAFTRSNVVNPHLPAANNSSPTPFHHSRAGSLEEFLLERYRAFNLRRGVKAWFPVWHPPWPVIALDVRIDCDTLTPRTGRWTRAARPAGGHYSPGVRGVWMGRPYRAEIP